MSDAGAEAPAYLTACIGGIAAGAVALAAVASFHHDLAIDEPFTALAIAHPSTLASTLVHDSAPLFYALLLAWTRVFGQSAFALRAMSMAAFGGAIAFTAGAALGARRSAAPGGEAGCRRNGRAAILAALLVACSVPFGLEPAAIARPYALLAMFAAMTSWAAARADAPRASRRDAMTLGAAHLLGLFTHPIFVFLSCASAASGALLATRRSRLAAAPLAAVAVYGATWGLMLSRTAALPATRWMTKPGGAQIRAGLLFWGDHATAILAALVVVLIALRGMRGIGARVRPVALPFAIAVLTLTAAVAVSQARPVYLASRTPVLVLPATAVALAVFVSEVSPVPVACAVAFLVGASAVRFTVQSAGRPDPYPTRTSLAALAAHMTCGDTLLAAGLSYAPIEYYAAAARVPPCVSIRPFPADVREHPGWVDLTTEARSRLGGDAERTAEAAGSRGTVWVFSASTGAGSDDARALLQALSGRRPLGKRLALRGSFFDEVSVFSGP